jgi:hypothetical protein
MGEVLPMPAVGDLFTDIRGGQRTMRVSYHGDKGVLVVSLWAGTVCRGSFQMAADNVSKLIGMLHEIELTVASAPTPDPQPRDSTRGRVGQDPEDPAVGDVPDQSEPRFKPTGDIAGTANRSPAPSMHVPRVA